MLSSITKNITPEKFIKNFDLFSNMWSKVVTQMTEIAPKNLIEAIEENMVYGMDLFGKNLTNSQNSSLPPSKDLPYKKPAKTSEKSDAEPKRKPGGQPNHPGHFLRHYIEPDLVVEVSPNLPKDVECVPTGQVIKRQVIDITFTSKIIEYRAAVYQDEFGNTYVGDFPPEARAYAQYGPGVREFSLFLSVYQLIPYERAADAFAGILGKPVSEGTINNFIRDAYEFLSQDYLPWAKCQVIKADVAFFDETPVNVAGNYASVLVACTDTVKLLECHAGRSIEDLTAMAVLPFFTGIAMSDNYAGTLAFMSCFHVLCGAHLLRELTGIHEKGGLRCGLLIKNFFKALKEKVDEAGGSIPDDELKKEIKHLNNLLTRAYTEIEDKSDVKTLSDVTIKFTKKATALINRIVKKMDAYLAFATDEKIPFDNNMAERALRMIKVLLKISGCFRTIENANMVCIIRGYIDTCRAHGMTAQSAISLLVKKQLPDFVNLNNVDQDLFTTVSQATKNYLLSLRKDATITDSASNTDATSTSTPTTDIEVETPITPNSTAEACSMQSDVEMVSPIMPNSTAEACSMQSDVEMVSPILPNSTAEACSMQSDVETRSPIMPNSTADECSMQSDGEMGAPITPNSTAEIKPHFYINFDKKEIDNTKVCLSSNKKRFFLKRRKVFIRKSYGKYNDSS